MILADLVGCRIWVTAKGYAPDEGGMQTYAQGVAEAWAAAGARVTVFTQTSKGPRREWADGIRLIDVGPGKSPLVPYRLARAMRRERAESGAPDLVHGTTWRTSLLPMMLGLRYAVTFHGREFMYGGPLALALIRRAARRAEAIVAVSAYSGARLRRRLGPGCPVPVVAWNGLSAPPLPDAPQGEPPLIFSVCRLEPRKNIVACVRACAALRKHGLAFRYVIGGRGPELGRIRTLVRELALEDCVEATGFLPSERIAQLHAAAAIFLHPQIEVDGGRDFEGFGIVIADAMAARTAVIAGQDGGACELMEHGVTGMVVDGRDDEAIEASLHRLLVDDAFRKGLAEAAREHARENFRWDRHIAKIAAAVSG